MVTNLNGKDIGAAYYARSEEPTLPKGNASECTPHEVVGQPLSVHHGRCSLNDHKDPRSYIPSMTTPQGPNDAASRMHHQTHPPGGSPRMHYLPPAVMSGVVSVAALLRLPGPLACNNGDVLVSPCRPFIVSLPNGIFWF